MYTREYSELSIAMILLEDFTVMKVLILGLLKDIQPICSPIQEQ